MDGHTDGGNGDDRRVSEYNPRTNIWRNRPKLQKKRYDPAVCTFDNKLFLLGGYAIASCEMLDLSDDDLHWRYIDRMKNILNRGHRTGGYAVVVERKIYVLGGYNDDSVEAYEVDQGLSKYLWNDIYKLS